MPLAKPRFHAPDLRAFSLVEMVVALGVFTFAIVAIFGLLSFSLTAEKAASSDTALAQMTMTALDMVRSQPFATVTTTNLYTTNASGISSPAMFFNINGQVALNATTAQLDLTAHSDSVYSCTILRRVPSGTPATTNLVYLQLTFRWPVAAPAANQQTRIMNASLANYD